MARSLFETNSYGYSPGFSPEFPFHPSPRLMEVSEQDNAKVGKEFEIARKSRSYFNFGKIFSSKMSLRIIR